MLGTLYLVNVFQLIDGKRSKEQERMKESKG
jgi:hypothetical protein